MQKSCHKYFLKTIVFNFRYDKIVSGKQNKETKMETQQNFTISEPVRTPVERVALKEVTIFEATLIKGTTTKKLQDDNLDSLITRVNVWLMDDSYKIAQVDEIKTHLLTKY
jgi:hypothetical protein